MNYNDEILENKEFNFFKQLMYNILLAFCLMLVVCLILVYGFGFTPYNVLTGSMEPIYSAGDMVIVKEQSSYSVGDIVCYKNSTFTSGVTHRIIAIVDDNGTTVYICHGDANQDADGGYDGQYEWEDDVEYLSGYTTKTQLTGKLINGEYVYLEQIEGKVITHIDNWGSYVNFISEHKWLFMAIVVAIWGISSTIQIEIDINKSRRLLK